MPGFIIHTTIEGERWDSIAHRYFGDAHRYPELIALNPHAPIQSILPGGLKLNIPDEPPALRPAADKLPPWKRPRA